MTGTIRLMLIAAICAGMVLAAPRTASAQQVETSFVHLGRGVAGVVYSPVDSGPKAGVGVFVMHAEADYHEAAPCTELSRRGYTVLCANTAVSKYETGTDFSMDEILLNAKLGVAYLRKRPGIRKIVLLGHSGGGALMAAYQDIAENGVKACQGPEKILKCSNDLAGLPPADGIILLDSNYGLGAMMLLSLDPAVTSEASGKHLDPALNLFNPSNGFRPNGSDYSADFIARWQRAVGRRNDALIRTAAGRLRVIEAGNGPFTDDDIFVVPGGSYSVFDNKLFAQDTRLLSHTKGAWPLIRKDGSVVTQVIHTVRVPENNASTTGSFATAALQTTLRHFLGSYAIRVSDDFGYGADGFRGIDWSSSYDAPASSVRGINVPLLAMGMTGHWEFLAAEIIYDNAVSPDKSIAFVEGATHLFATCKPCERTPGQFGDTMKTTFDYVDLWLSKPGRF